MKINWLKKWGGNRFAQKKSSSDRFSSSDEAAARLGDGVGQTATEPSPRVRAHIDQLMRDPSKGPELALNLQRDDPELFLEVLQWLGSYQERTAAQNEAKERDLQKTKTELPGTRKK